MKEVRDTPRAAPSTLLKSDKDGGGEIHDALERIRHKVSSNSWTDFDDFGDEILALQVALQEKEAGE